MGLQPWSVEYAAALPTTRPKARSREAKLHGRVHPQRPRALPRPPWPGLYKFHVDALCLNVLVRPCIFTLSVSEALLQRRVAGDRLWRAVVSDTRVHGEGPRGGGDTGGIPTQYSRNRGQFQVLR